MKYGRQFGRQVGEYEYQGLQDSFHFHKIEGGGYENSAVNFYKFENNNLKRVASKVYWNLNHHLRFTCRFMSFVFKGLSLIVKFLSL